MKVLAAAFGTAALAVSGFLVADRAGVVSLTGSTATTVSVPAPQNLRVVEAGETTVKVSYGPSVVGPLRIAPFDNGKGAKITWAGSTDALYPLGITYMASKNGKDLWAANKAQTYANVGFTLAVRKFTTCVVPHSTSGFGPKRCVTWTAPP
jgi:hypothetical protein